MHFTFDSKAQVYANHIQCDRCNLKEKDLILLIAEVDKRKERDIEAGTMSIYAAYYEAQEKRKREPTPGRLTTYRSSSIFETSGHKLKIHYQSYR